MPRILHPLRAAGQSTPADQHAATRSTDVDQDLAVWRRAVEECGWTYEALEAFTGKDKSYLHRVLNGDKPMTQKFQKALPDDIERRYHRLRVEALGLVVLEPPASTESGEHLILTGVLAILRRAALPTKADRLAKADVIERTAAKVAR